MSFVICNVKKEGFRVTVANSHKTAEKIIDEIDNDSIAFIDINLPDGNGYVLANKLKSKNQDSTVYLISAREIPGDLELRNSMADGFIPKPFSKKEIFEVVNEN
ncbi:response regulator [Mangrovivirga cuniculi]|uniref:Response regulator n=1 Tax=Mangrovivirga cuniculi TaxID=2715131 RepID=A0A4D7K976_9BACT|nr:response regulator [Mangrovivirga cuniculi]QCK15858.1 response regulator [Mangrovivirga cuniculi]